MLEPASASCFWVSDAIIESPVSLGVIFLREVGLFFSFDDFKSSEGNLGRDFLTGFLTLGRSFCESFSSKLNLAGRELGPPFSLDSAVGEVFFRPSLGDLGLVVGIYIKK